MPKVSTPAVTRTSYVLGHPIIPTGIGGPYTATKTFGSLNMAVTAHETLMRSTDPHLTHKYQITLDEVTTTRLRDGAVEYSRPTEPPTIELSTLRKVAAAIAQAAAVLKGASDGASKIAVSELIEAQKMLNACAPPRRRVKVKIKEKS